MKVRLARRHGLPPGVPLHKDHEGQKGKKKEGITGSDSHRKERSKQKTNKQTNNTAKFLHWYTINAAFDTRPGFLGHDNSYCSSLASPPSLTEIPKDTKIRTSSAKERERVCVCVRERERECEKER